jgi:hypothetical protein
VSIASTIGAGITVVGVLATFSAFGIVGLALLYGMVMDVLCLTGYVDEDIRTMEFHHPAIADELTAQGTLMYFGRVVNAILVLLTVLYIVGLVAIELGVVQA